MGRKLTIEVQLHHHEPSMLNDASGRIFVCRGGEKGCYIPPGFGPCTDCYMFFHDDRRTHEQIVHDMRRGDS